jgi:hypothetical protein
VTTPGLEIDASAQLALSINGLAAQMAADRRWRADLAADVSFVQAPPFTVASLPAVAGSQWGPNTGFNWAVQRISVSGFGATTDYVNAYRGTTAAQAVGNNALYTFQEAVAGAVSTWHPGRTGLVLRGDESLCFAGTFTGSASAPLYFCIDVIQLTDAQLPYFLL